MRRLLPVEVAKAIASDLGAIIVQHGWSPGPTDNPLPRSGEFPLDDVQRLIINEFCIQRSIQEAPHAAEIRLFFDDFFGESAFLHPIIYPRIGAPSRATLAKDITAPHQDYLHIQGSRRTTTAWLALTSCGNDDGALEFAAGTHHGPLYPRVALVGPSPTDGFHWIRPSYEPGDVLLFDALTVHRARANRGNRFRLSMDFRMQPLSEPVCDESIASCYVNGISWEKIYSQIFDNRIRYYWKRKSPRVVVPFNRTLALTPEPIQFKSSSDVNRVV